MVINLKISLKHLACFGGAKKKAQAGKGRADFSCQDVDPQPLEVPPSADTQPGGGNTLPRFQQVTPPSPGLGQDLSSSLLFSSGQMSKDGPIAPPAGDQTCYECPPCPLPVARSLGLPCPNPHNGHLEAMALEGMPSSLAVISCDAKEVIYHRFGLDPAAAQLLRQTLQFNGSSSGAAQASTSRGTEQPADKSSSTFLAALLGCEVEAVALREARNNRFWKGTVTPQLPRGAPSWEISAHSSARQSPADIFCPLSGVAPGKDSSSSVLKQAAQASGPQARSTPPAEQPSNHGATDPQLNTRSSKSVQWVVPGQPEAASKALEGPGEASSVPGAAIWWLPTDAGSRSSHKLPEMHSRSYQSSVEHDQEPHIPGSECVSGYLPNYPLISCPKSHSFRKTRSSDMDAAWEEGGSGKQDRGEKGKPVRSKSTSLRSRRGSLFRPEAIEQLVHESKNEDCTRTIALLTSISNQQARRNTSSGIPECVSAPQQGGSKSEAIRRSSQWAEVQGFLSDSVFSSAGITQQHSAKVLDTGQHGPNMLYQRSSAVPVQQDPQQRKQASSSDMWSLDHPTFHLLTPDQQVSSNPLMDSIQEHQVGYAGRNFQASSSEQACNAVHDKSLPGPPNTFAVENGRNLVLEPTHQPFPSPRLSLNDRFSGASSQMLLCAQDCPLSFDFTVSMCRPELGSRSPLLVVISNSTEHSQVRTTLLALAEMQLEVLSSALPQHAIQFLATESVEVLPKHVGQLARAHQDVTILFMDIVGFTSMSKNCKPVEVMVFLNTLFATFDRLVDFHAVHKVETAGDCYIVSGGIMSPNQPGKGFGLVVEEKHDPKDSARRVMEFAKSLLETARQVRMPDTLQPVRVRVGLHTGDVVTGLIGSKLPKFSVFGDTMNTAARMESTGLPGWIHVSEATHALLKDYEQWEATGGVEVKGKGLMNTYLWAPSCQRPTYHFTGPPRAASPDERLSCMQLMHAHTLLRQFPFSRSSMQRLAAQQHRASISPSLLPSKHTAEMGP